mmetsp:Transcript_48496/g.58515  ORF Transcript_48496/g.58515 Transcript_48496/m.58515 type:complete len:696 (+) Transcript_48496:117-2204(+)
MPTEVIGIQHIPRDYHQEQSHQHKSDIHIEYNDPNVRYNRNQKANSHMAPSLNHSAGHYQYPVQQQPHVTRESTNHSSCASFVSPENNRLCNSRQMSASFDDTGPSRVSTTRLPSRYSSYQEEVRVGERYESLPRHLERSHPPRHDLRYTYSGEFEEGRARPQYSNASFVEYPGREERRESKRRYRYDDEYDTLPVRNERYREYPESRRDMPFSEYHPPELEERRRYECYPPSPSCTYRRRRYTSDVPPVFRKEPLSLEERGNSGGSGSSDMGPPPSLHIRNLQSNKLPPPLHPPTSRFDPTEAIKPPNPSVNTARFDPNSVSNPPSARFDEPRKKHRRVHSSGLDMLSAAVSAADAPTMNKPHQLQLSFGESHKRNLSLMSMGSGLGSIDFRGVAGKGVLDKIFGAPGAEEQGEGRRVARGPESNQNHAGSTPLSPSTQALSAFSNPQAPTLPNPSLSQPQTQSSFNSQSQSQFPFQSQPQSQQPSPSFQCQIVLPNPRRTRRRCSHPECPNRVVQGGKCISHGAKRKTCSRPDCTKNVKKSGLCSTHGPSRKRCEVNGCEKVAVQRGKCIGHGAKKKSCSVEGCAKQSILRGMCKKHHDANLTKCVVIDEGKTADKEISVTKPALLTKPTMLHKRGLSIFHDMNAIDIIVAGKSSQTRDGLTNTSIAAAPESQTSEQGVITQLQANVKPELSI